MQKVFQLYLLQIIPVSNLAETKAVVNCRNRA